MGIGPLARWKNANLPDIAARLRWAFVASLVAALTIPFAMGHWSAMVAFGILLAAWVAASGVVQLYEKIGNAANGAGAWARLRNTPRATYGMLLAHFGVAVFVTGVTLVKGYDSERDVRMEAGDIVELGRLHVPPRRREGRAGSELRRRPRPNPSQPERTSGHDALSREAHLHGAEHADDRSRDRSRLHARPVRLARRLRERDGVDRSGAAQTLHRLDMGRCLLMALGGALAASDRRYRVAAKRQEPYAAAQAAR